MGRALLNGEVRDQLAGPFEPGQVHHFLASVGARLLVITTNYDELLEQAFRAVGHDPHVVYHPFDDPTEPASFSGTGLTARWTNLRRSSPRT